VFNDGYGTITLTNSTVSGNHYLGSFDNISGGIDNCYGSVTLVNSTISNNNATSGSGAIGNNDWGFCTGGTVQIKNTIIADNPNGNCAGVITSLGHNIDSENTCSFTNGGDLTNTNPLLGSLQDNGGSTFTHALMIGSPAIDAGDNNGCPVTDQRGYYRDTSCDIGSYEYGASSPSISTLTPTVTNNGTPAATRTATP
jgi:hypothetical protein